MNKEIYLIFENDPEFGFEFQLAEKLHMTVAELRMKMDNWEFAAWVIYYARKAQQQELAQKSGK